MEETVAVKLEAQLAVLIEELRKLNQNILKINAANLPERKAMPQNFSGGNGKSFGYRKDKKHFNGFNRSDRMEKRFIADGRKKEFKPKKRF